MIAIYVYGLLCLSFQYFCYSLQSQVFRFLGKTLFLACMQAERTRHMWWMRTAKALSLLLSTAKLVLSQYRQRVMDKRPVGWFYTQTQTEVRRCRGVGVFFAGV